MNNYLQEKFARNIFDMERVLTSATPPQQARSTFFQFNAMHLQKQQALCERLSVNYRDAFYYIDSVNEWILTTANFSYGVMLALESGVKDYLIENNIKPLPYFFYDRDDEDEYDGEDVGSTELEIGKTEQNIENTVPVHENTVPAHENTVPAQEFDIDGDCIKYSLFSLLYCLPPD